MSCVICSKETNNTLKCIECKQPFCTSCQTKRKQGRCPAHYKEPTGGSGGGGSVDFASNDFEKDEYLIRASDGYSYFVFEGELPYRIIPSKKGWSGFDPKTKRIMGTIQQNYNPEDYGPDDVSDAYKTVIAEFACHGDSAAFGTHCDTCGLEILEPNWDGENLFGEVSDEESS